LWRTVAGHRHDELVSLLSIYDVANAQYLAGRLLRDTLGFTEKRCARIRKRLRCVTLAMEGRTAGRRPTCIPSGRTDTPGIADRPQILADWSL